MVGRDVGVGAGKGVQVGGGGRVDGTFTVGGSTVEVGSEIETNGIDNGELSGETNGVGAQAATAISEIATRTGTFFMATSQHSYDSPQRASTPKPPKK